MATDRRVLTPLTTPGALRVPEITVYFWVIKALSTALGESTSDYLVHVMNPVFAVALGFVFFAGALILQFCVRRYIAWTYWLAVVMVGVFGTMAADVLHVGFGVPYTVSAILYAVALAAVFFTWARTEHTLSIHSIDTPRREIFYWLAVVATFAMGTALGDFTAFTLHLGYLTSALLFAVVIAIPAIGYWVLRWNAIFSFWFAYVATRPLGASFADYLGKPKSVGGLGVGAGPVVLVLAFAIFCLVAFLAVTRRDVQHAGVPRGSQGAPRHTAGARVPAMEYARPYRDAPAADRARPYRDDPYDDPDRTYRDVRSGDPARQGPYVPPPGYPPRRPDGPPAGYPRQRPDDQTMEYPRHRRPDLPPSEYPPGRPGNPPRDDRRPRPDDPTMDYRRPRPDDPMREYRRPRPDDPGWESPGRWPDPPR